MEEYGFILLSISNIAEGSGDYIPKPAEDTLSLTDRHSCVGGSCDIGVYA